MTAIKEKEVPTNDIASSAVGEMHRKFIRLEARPSVLF